MNVASDFSTKLTLWNATERPYPQDRCIHQLFEDQVARTPEAIAVIFEDQQLTYSQLNAKANQLAHYLRDHGVGPDVPVGICMDRSLEMIIALYGVLKAGGAYVPLDPIYPRDRIEHIVKESRISILLTDSVNDSLAEGLGQIRLNLDTANSILSELNSSNPSWSYPTDALAYIIYTSGSTGKPKGVMIEHRGILNRLLWMQEAFPLKEFDRVLQKTPYSFDVSVWEFFWPLMYGAQLVVIRPGGHKDPDYLIHTIVAREITVLHFVPSMLQIFLQHPDVEICRSIKQVFTSGEALGLDDQKRFFQRLSAELHNLYGPTEAAVDVSWWECSPHSTLSSVPIGKPIANTQLHILDSAMNPVSPGVEGDLYIGGIQVARGYVNRPELTAELFTQDPFSNDPSDRLYKTGDICRYMEDGNIEYLGRADDQVKIRGFRIELGEIESVLRSHPAIKQAVVLAREDEPGQKVLTAYVVPREPEAMDEERLRLHLTAELPEYMLPSVFVELETLPLTTSGKTDRKALPPPKKPSTFHPSGTIPQTETQRILAEIWQRILGLPSVCLEDNFFQLGGHSLKAIQTIYQVQSRFDIRIAVSCLFENPTMHAFAEAVQTLCSQDTNRAITIPPVSRELPIPQSFAQQRLWFIEQFALKLPVYNISFLILMNETLNISALEKSIRTIVHRHEAFRTTFQLREGKTVQLIQPARPWKLNIDEVSVPDGRTPEEEFSAIAKIEAKKFFDLEKGPLFDFHLLQAAPDHHALILSMHHLITDGWSMGVISKELSELYNAHVEGRPPNLPNLQIHSCDFACWQRQQLPSLLNSSLDYWQETLAGELPEVTLPGDHPRAAVQTYNGDWLDHSIKPELYAHLQDLSRRQHVTLNMTLMTAFKVLLYRLLGTEDIVIGSPISGRTHPQIENLVGFFVNTVVLRTNFKGNPTFLESLERVRRTSQNAQEHQELPYEVVVERLNPQRDPSRNLYFQIMFAFQDARNWQPKLSGLQVQGIEIGTDTAKYDLTVFAEENEQGLAFRAEYNTDLYNRSTIRRFLQLFEHALKTIVAKPHQTIDQISLLMDKDRQAISQWNATERPYPQDRCIHQLFEDQVAKTPDTTAVVFEDQTLTYSQLNAKANKLAHYLRDHGVGPDVPVGICMDRSLEMIAVLLATLKAGGAYVPLDPLYPPKRLRFMADTVGIRLIVANGGLQATFSEAVEKLDPTRTPIIKSYPTTNPSPSGPPANLAYIMFTSGSTGTPKGVAVPHRGPVRLVFGQDFIEFGPDLTMLQLAPVSFDASTLEIWGPLLHGGRCVLYPGRVVDFAMLEEVLRRQHITTLWLTASLFNSIIDTRPQLLETVTAILTGGEALSVTHIRKALDALPHVQLINGYGPTESTTFTCCYRIPRNIEETARSIPIGRPIGNTQVYILDSNHCRVPVGIAGELYIGGEGLARGYVNQPELTAERFIPDPMSEDQSSRLYKTGDICRYLADGNIEYLGRTDDQVKIRGFRIELGEIENVLRSHPSVQHALAIAREELESKYLEAFVVLENKGEINGDALRKWLTQKLPEYTVPSMIIELTSFPLTTSGKVDRKALPMQRFDHGQTQRAPAQTATEIELAEIWQQLLKLESIERSDHFFQLGGHSLLAAELFFRIRQSFAIHLPIHTIFQAPTLQQLAAVIDTATWDMTTKELVLIKPGKGPYPIFYLPGIGGHTLSFYHLAEAMQLDLPQYGLNLPGLDGRTEPLESIEAIARFFIDLIVAVQPHGPYHLCGYSFGGRVAFEMALQLQAAGETISFLGLLGTTAPGYPPMPENRWLRTAYRFYDFLSIGPMKQWSYLRFKIGEKVANRHKQSAHRHLPDQQHVVDKAMRAWYRYVPSRPFSGKVDVYRESKTFSDLYDRYNDPQYGWAKYVDGTINSHMIECAHVDLFKAPHVTIIGGLIEQRI